MPNTFNSSTFSETYKDDYSDSNGYYRVLFNSGRALQARELTQMQTILHKEIERFGRNIFKEGATVNPGGVTVNNRYAYVKITSSGIPSDPSTLIGRTATARAPAATISFKILEYVAATDSDPATLYVRYTDTTDATAGSTPITVEPGASLDLGGGFDDLIVQSSDDPTGFGTKAHCADGDYFTQGYFVYAQQQSHFVSKYSSTPTVDLGFRVDQDIVTIDDTNTLYDNQGAEYNTASPGADRFRIRLTLTTRDEIDSDENFVYVARITNGVVSHVSDGKSDYNKIGDLLAQRTKEESGDYIVNDFQLVIKDEGVDSNLTLNVSRGIAYVDGYRLEIPPTKILLPRAQDIDSVAGETIIAQYGNYVQVTGGKGVPNIGTFELMNLYDTAGGTGTQIGTARVRQFFPSGIYYRMYLFDIKMSAGQSFSSVLSIGTGTTNFWNTVTEDGLAVLKSTADNSLLWDLPRSKPTETGITVGSFYTQRRVTFSTDGAGAGTISTTSLGSGLDLVNTSDWVISLQDSAPDTGYSLGTVSGTSVSISGLEASSTYEALVYVDEGTGSAKSKVYNTNQTVTRLWPDSADSDGFGNLYLSLGVADAVKISEVRRTDANGPDFSPYFRFDNGQRDNFYDISRLVPYNENTTPRAPVYVKFDYLSHTGTGEFFDVSSYDGVIDYGVIPDYKKANGEIVSLRDVLDFRSVKNDGGSFSTYFPIPQAGFGVSANIGYYLPRNDKIVVSRNTDTTLARGANGKVELIQGTSSFNPKFPQQPTSSLSLYDISLNAYTANDSDLTVTPIVNRRYTMKDIARLDERINQLAELSTLSLLEVDTQTLTVLDSNGNPRTKAGFIADNFTSFAFSEIERETYRASIDTNQGQLGPSISLNNIFLTYDSDTSTPANTIRKGDLVMLDYTDTVFVNQDLATETININPFEVITQTGHLTLSPTSDNWVETQWQPDRITQGADQRRFVGDTWRWNRNGLTSSWFGEDAGTGRVITASRTSTRFVGNRVVDTEVIPFMRSIYINFKAQGLRPNTQYFPYFRNIDVSDWCREETTFTEVGVARTVPAVPLTATERPTSTGAKSDLISDDKGEIIGSFVVPSTSSLRFQTGLSEFKLLDITGGNDDDAVSSTRATFNATGTLEFQERVFESVRTFDVANFRQLVNFDPLAQSFLVDVVANPNGVFITQVGVFFSTLDENNIPVQCQIRPVENGLPTPFPLPGAVKFLTPGIDTEIVVPAEADLNDLDAVKAKETIFKFDEPIYLSPNQEYAVVLLAESKEYNVYVAKTYEFVLGTTAQRVNRQPTLGSLFKSQNGTTWTPDQDRDLMFKLYRAEFATSGNAYLENIAVPSKFLPRSSFQVDSGDSDVYVYAPGHGLIAGDGVTIAGLEADSYAGIITAAINGNRQVLRVDHTGFVFGAAVGYTANSAIRFGETETSYTPNYMYDEYYPQVQAMEPGGTSITPYVKRTTGASYAGDRNLTSNNAYNLSTGWSSDIILNERNILSAPSVVAGQRNDQKGNIAGARTFQLKLDMATSDTKVSPVIDLQRVSASFIENVIDKQDSSATDGFNVPINTVLETHPTAGTHAAKHITTQTILANPAVGLKILLAANRPSVSDFYVYYKTATSDVDLNSVSWTLVNKEADLPADENPGVYRQYEYLAGGQGGNLPTFTKFQVKIVMVTTNTSKVPTFRDLRVVALVI